MPAGEEANVATIERVSPNDMMSLVTDHGQVPVNMAAVLHLAPGVGLDLATVRAILGQRVTGIRRLRQRLVDAPVGCGRPVWVDDADFDIDRHVLQTRLAQPQAGDELLRLAAALVCARLARSRPLWTARLVTGLPEDWSALILVMHHVLADGLGGLAVLAALSDGFPAGGPEPFPRPAPSRRDLALDAARSRVETLRRLPGGVAQAVRGVRELSVGGQVVPRFVERVSILRPTTPRRRLTVLATPLQRVVAAAHERGGTVNDAVVASISGAIVGLLTERGERARELVVSMPISTRRSAGHRDLGNQVGVAPVRVPFSADFEERLRAIAAQSSTARAGQRGSSAGLLALIWRGLAVFGLVQYFVDHQRLVHTFVTNLRGPEARLRFAGAEIERVVPIVVNPGNVAVTFDVLSYAGELVCTVVADPEVIPDQGELTALLAQQLDDLATAPAGP